MVCALQSECATVCSNVSDHSPGPHSRSAETGAGASITSVNQPRSGKEAILSAAASTASTTAACTVPGRPAPADCAIPARSAG